MSIQPLNNGNNIKKAPSFGSKSSIANRIANSSIVKKIEFDSFNMAWPVFMVTMFIGVLLPRLKQAQSSYDREEIAFRDVTSITTMGVGSVLLNKGFSFFNEKKSGFALANKPEGFKEYSGIKKLTNYLKPVNGVTPLSSRQLISKYSELEKYKDGISGFCNFVDEQGGDLKKLFSFNKETKSAVENICGGAQNFAKATNKQIIDYIGKARDNKNENIKKILKEFKNKDNDFVKKAKTMNSMFGFLSTFLLVPVFLGFILPYMNGQITKRKYKERNAIKNETQDVVAINNQINKAANSKKASKVNA